MIQQLKGDYPVRQLCATLDCPTSTSYYVPRCQDESREVAAIEQVLLRFPFYGYRKVHQQLLRQGVSVGEHVVRRLLREMGATRSVGQVRVQTTDSNHPPSTLSNRIKGLRLKQPDQVWGGPTSPTSVSADASIYLAVVLDAYTRAVRGLGAQSQHRPAAHPRLPWTWPWRTANQRFSIPIRGSQYAAWAAQPTVC